MKSLFFLLAFFMLSLSCIPCGDAEDCNTKKETAMYAAGNHDHDSHGAETCTPFCGCACCAVPVNVQQVIVTKAPAFNMQVITFLYNDAYHSHNTHTIWQPPRLG